MEDNKDKLENEHKNNKKRKIEFRAKAKNKKCWVVGDLIHCENGYSIIEKKGGCIKVKPETIGQFTGLYDKNGKDIYEGDVVEDVFDDCSYTVMFDEKRGGWYPFACGDGCGCCEAEVTQPKYCKVVGNIYDNGG